MVVLTASEMRDVEARFDSVALMRAAGARLAERIVAQAHDAGVERAVAFAGPGNNGGDAFAAFAELATQYPHLQCRIYTSHPEPAEGLSDARHDAMRRAREAGVAVFPLPETDADALAAVAEPAVLVDALFGTGVRLPIAERYRAAMRACDARRGRIVVSADMPTGVDATTGSVDDDAVHATETLCFAALKPAALLEPSRSHCGTVRVADIGIDTRTLAAHARTFAALDDATFLAQLPTRPENADKRSSGAPLIIAGSEQFPGAAVLCARGAARAGAGYVTVVTTERAAPALRMHLVEQVVVTIDERAPANDVVETILDIARRNGSIAIGPGLGLDDRTGDIVRGVLTRTGLPAVVDASALFHLAKALEPLRAKPLVVTPHAGEFARLSGKGTIAPGTRVARLREFVERTGITTLLKGNDTLIHAPGGPVHINATGSNALATAGTGDVLTGMIATLLAQGLAPLDAAVCAAYWHGLSGTYCAAKRRRGVIAGDIADALGFALPDERA